MRRMERQAQQTDRAIHGLGKTLDRAMGRDTQRVFDRHDRQVKQVNQQYRMLGQSSQIMGQHVRRSNHDIEDGTSKLIKHGQAIAAIGKITSVLKWPAMAAGAGLLVQVVSQLSAGVVALIPQVTDLAGVVGVLPSTFLGVAGGMAAAALALGGVGKALQAGIQLHQQSALTALQVADQHAQVAQAMTSAEHGIVLAQRGSRDSQIALTQARRDAIRNLTDLRLAARAAALGEQGANLTLQRARLDLQKMMFTPGTTALDIQQQQLSIKEAELGVTQSHVTRTRAVHDRNRADKLGVTRNQQVVHATEAVTDAMWQQKTAADQLAAAQRQVREATLQGAGAQGQFDLAMRNLTPDARKFTRHLLGFQPLLRRLRIAAGRDLFPGLTHAIDRLPRAMPTAERVLRRFGGSLGDVANRASRRFTGRGFLSDFESLSAQGATGINRFGTSLINVADAFRHIGMAARPFTDWFQRVIVRGSKSFDKWAEAGRKSGRLGLFFDRARRALVLFWDITKNVYGTLKGIGQAARPLGNDLWRSADRATKRWKDFTNSFKGQLTMREWFDNSRGTIHQTLGLVADIGKAIFRMGNQPRTAAMIHQIRGMVPDLERLLNALAGTFGPAFLTAISQILRLFTNLAGLATPFATVLDLFNKILGAINKAIEGSKTLRSVFQAAFSLLILNRFLSKLGSIRDRLGGVQRVAGRGRGTPGAAAIPRGVQQVWVVNMPGGGFGGRGGPGGGGGPMPTGGRGGGGGRIRNWWRRGSISAQFPASGTRAAPTLLQRLGGRAAWAAGGLRAAPGLALGALRGLGPGGLLRGAGKLGLGALKAIGGPEIAVLSGLIGAATTHGGVAARVQGFGDAASFGLTGVVRNALGIGNNGPSDAQLTGREGRGIQKALHGMGGDSPTTRDLEHQVRYLHTMVTLRRNETGAEAHLRVQLEQQLRIRRQMVGTAHAQQRAARAEHGRTLADQVKRGFENLKGPQGPVAAMKWMTDHALGHMQNMKKEGVKTLAESTLQWAHRLARGNPAMEAQVDRLKQGVIDRFKALGGNVSVINGQILSGTRTEWHNIRKAITDQTNSAVQEGSKAFDNLQRKAIGSLMSMGFSRSQARGIVSGMRSGGMARKVAANDVSMGVSGAGQTYSQSTAGLQAAHGYATGGRLAGKGLRDSVWVTPGNKAAPGELVLNRHTEAKLDHAAYNYYGRSVDQMVRGEHTPHYMATGGRLAGHPELHQGVRSAAEEVLSKFPGLMVTATTNGHHAKNSLHYSGQAIDLAAAMTPAGIALMNTAAGWAGRNIGGGLAEGIHNPNLSIQSGKNVDPSNWGAATWQEHLNHIHLGVLGGRLSANAARGGGHRRGQRFNLPGIHTKLGGAPGAMAQAVMDATRVGMQRKVRRALRASAGGGGAGDYSGLSGGGNAQENMRLGRQMMLRRWGAGEWGSLRSLWMGESGWNENALNKSSGATGIPQALPGNKMASKGADWRTNPKTQMAWGLDYIADVYGSPSRAFSTWQGRSPHWYDKGGRIPWFGQGTDFVATRPQLIGVGDGGSERVTVRPVGRSGTGGIRIDKIVVQNHRSGDIKAQIKKEVREAFNELASELDGLPIEDAEEAMH